MCVTNLQIDIVIHVLAVLGLSRSASIIINHHSYRILIRQVAGVTRLLVFTNLLRVLPPPSAAENDKKVSTYIVIDILVT